MEIEGFPQKEQEEVATQALDVSEGQVSLPTSPTFHDAQSGFHDASRGYSSEGVSDDATDMGATSEPITQVAEGNPTSNPVVAPRLHTTDLSTRVRGPFKASLVLDAARWVDNKFPTLLSHSRERNILIDMIVRRNA